MNVYVVTRYYYNQDFSTSMTEKIFSNQKAAEDYIFNNEGNKDELEWEEWEVNSDAKSAKIVWPPPMERAFNEWKEHLDDPDALLKTSKENFKKPKMKEYLDKNIVDTLNREVEG